MALLDDNGQAIILSVLIAGVLLLALACYVSASSREVKSSFMPDDTCNIKWAQECGLKGLSTKSSGIYAWTQRGEAARSFIIASETITSGVGDAVRKRGSWYSFCFNDSLAKASMGPGMESVDGVILKSSGGMTMIFGCAYDVEVVDETGRYLLSEVCIFG